MIIGINGYSGSGKDTVGKIIQYLTASDHSKECFQRIEKGLSIDGYHNSAWENKKWAGKLKVIASLLTGIPIEKFEDQEFKKQALGREWSYPTEWQGREHWVEMTVREFLQRLGTEAIRNGLHTNAWVNSLLADYKAQPNKDVAAFLAAEGLPQSMNGGEQEFPNWVVTDTRFRNEAQAIKDAGGIVIRVERPGVKPINPHPSETDLDEWPFDHKIYNASDLTSLAFSVQNILRKENLL